MPVTGYSDDLRLAPVAARLGELLGAPVAAASDIIGDDAQRVVGELGDGDVAVLENLRFDARETKNDREFARALASEMDLYVNDAFGAAHRAHASVEALVALMPEAGAGLLMEKGLRYLGEALSNPARPFGDRIGVRSRLRMRSVSPGRISSRSVRPIRSVIRRTPRRAIHSRVSAATKRK